MAPDGDAARPPLAPSKLVLDEVNLAARRRHLEPEAMKLLIPKIAVSLAGFSGVYSAFPLRGRHRSA